jgi:tRNA(Arg) A34 adenosine deaminase TadA
MTATLESKKHLEYMKKAINKCREGIQKGQTPFGACIVQGNRVIACAHNTVWEDTDITAHAEINAIKQACAKLKSVHLSDCVIYSTTEPCPMCFSAIHWARIKEIYYGTSITDAKQFGFNELEISNQAMNDIGKCSMEITSNILHEECLDLFKEWKKINKDKTY